MFSIYLTAWAVMSIVSYAVYGWDKLQAKRGGWRVKEITLLLLALFMGAPGALLCMYTLRHKTLKPKFTITVPVFLIVQAAGCVFLIL